MLLFFLLTCVDTYASKGRDVYYIAELHSSGGGTLLKVIEDNLSHMQETGDWKIKSLEVDAGFYALTVEIAYPTMKHLHHWRSSLESRNTHCIVRLMRFFYAYCSALHKKLLCKKI